MKISAAKTLEIIEEEAKYSAHNYHPLPLVLTKGEGLYLTDVEGKTYFDFLSAYSAVNQGHCHPKITETLIDQAQKLTLTSRAFHNDQFGDYAKYVTSVFHFDKVLPMNTGAEAVETAMKICRKWGYEKKGISKNQAVILFATGNFHGRTLGIVSASNDQDSKGGFGPFLDGIAQVEYNNVDQLKTALQNVNVAALFLEPIQGEAGVVVPDDVYMQEAARLCQLHNVILVADEIQTGLGRTGKMLCMEHYGVKPDMVLLGKALSGGTVPVSAVLTSNEIMEVIKPGQHGSTYGGSPLGCAVAKTAIQVLLDENMMSNAEQMGQLFRSRIEEIALKSDLIESVRGKGLLNAIVINSPEDSTLAWDICIKLMENGLLAKPTHGNKIRFAPPLIITKEQMDEALAIIESTFDMFSDN